MTIKGFDETPEQPARASPSGKTRRPKNGSLDQNPLPGRERREWEKSVIRSAGKREQNHLLRVLLQFAGGKADCFPSVATIATEAGTSVKTVKRALKALDRLGVIATVEDGSIPTHRRIVFPSHPHADLVLRRFPRYMKGGHSVPPAPTCRGDNSGRRKGDKLDRCRGDILTPEIELEKSKIENEVSYSRRSPVPHARARSAGRDGGRVDSDSNYEERERLNEEFARWYTKRQGDSAFNRALARVMAEGSEADRLIDAMRGIVNVPSPDNARDVDLDEARRRIEEATKANGVDQDDDFDDIPF